MKKAREFRVSCEAKNFFFSKLSKPFFIKTKKLELTFNHKKMKKKNQILKEDEEAHVPCLQIFIK